MANYIIKNNNVVVINRGDFFKINLQLEDRETPFRESWTLEEGDVVYFALMEPHQPFECALVKKELTYKDYDSEGILWVKLYPEDTIDLIPGTYYYQAKAIYKVDNDEDLHLDTVIQKTKFIIVD